MRSMIRRFGSAPIIVALLGSLWLAGCARTDTGTETEEPAAEPAAEEPAAAEESGDLPRVYFVNLEDGQTIPTTYDVEFGVENYEIEPVTDPPTVNEGRGHYHIAIDEPCVPQGEVIAQGTPGYVHFGDGSNSITLQLEPGEHTLCLQVADGEHRMPVGEDLTGLTQQLTVTVQEQ